MSHDGTDENRFSETRPGGERGTSEDWRCRYSTSESILGGEGVVKGSRRSEGPDKTVRCNLTPGWDPSLLRTISRPYHKRNLSKGRISGSVMTSCSL